MDLPATIEAPSPDTAASATIYHLVNVDESKCIAFSPSSEIAIGRDAKVCKLFFPECVIMSRIHCRVFSFGRDVFVHDYSSNGTFLNGKLVGRDGKRKLRSGDSISVINPSLADAEAWNWKFIGLPEDDGQTAPDDPVSQVYNLGRVLGTGNFATVRLGTALATGEKVAVKIIEKKRFAMQADFSFSSLQSEVEILRKMKHNNIISVIDVFDSPKTFSMVLELVSGGDLFDYIVGRGVEPFTEDEARLLFVQLLEAMLYMHSQDVVHRDLKPENIMVRINPSVPLTSSDHQVNSKSVNPNMVTLKITDFGLAKFCSEQDVMTTMCGTPSYLAPEVLQPNADGTKRAAGYGWTVDVWSLGIILYIMLSGSPPKNPQHGVVFNKHFEHIGEEGMSLIVLMLQVDPRKRASLSDIVHHGWLANVAVKGKELALKHDNIQLQDTAVVQPLKIVQPSINGGNLPLLRLVTPVGSTINPVSLCSTATNSKDPPLQHDSNATESEDSDTEDGQLRKRDREEASVLWKWKKYLSRDDDEENAWELYHPEDSDHIERMRQKGVRTCRLTSMTTYRISFEGMFQYCRTNSGKKRPIKRLVVDL